MAKYQTSFVIDVTINAINRDEAQIIIDEIVFDVASRGGKKYKYNLHQTLDMKEE